MQRQINKWRSEKLLRLIHSHRGKPPLDPDPNAEYVVDEKRSTGDTIVWKKKEEEAKCQRREDTELPR